MSVSENLFWYLTCSSAFRRSVMSLMTMTPPTHSPFSLNGDIDTWVCLTAPALVRVSASLWRIGCFPRIACLGGHISSQRKDSSQKIS